MAEPYPGINLISSYLPDPFGTHHSKMIILFRHDDCAQIIIHTANMISKDWANMTQAIWRSPLLPLCIPASASRSSSSEKEATKHPIGSGERFKIDLLHYLAKYENRLRALSSQLTNYDFSAVRAAFLGSALLDGQVSKKSCPTSRCQSRLHQHHLTSFCKYRQSQPWARNRHGFHTSNLYSPGASYPNPQHQLTSHAPNSTSSSRPPRKYAHL
jgi:hypothetical protein